jgi:hypothetical protein
MFKSQFFLLLALLGAQSALAAVTLRTNLNLNRDWTCRVLLLI